jgi:hypothetical protein
MRCHRIAIGIQGGHTHPERIRLRFRLEELNAACLELGEVLPKIVRLDEERPDAGHGLFLAGLAEPKQHFESLVLEGYRQEPALRSAVIGTFLEAQRSRVEIQRFSLIRHQHRHVHDPSEHLRSSMLVEGNLTDLTIQRPRM